MHPCLQLLAIKLAKFLRNPVNQSFRLINENSCFETGIFGVVELQLFEAVSQVRSLLKDIVLLEHCNLVGFQHIGDSIIYLLSLEMQ